MKNFNLKINLFVGILALSMGMQPLVSAPGFLQPVLDWGKNGLNTVSSGMSSGAAKFNNGGKKIWNGLKNKAQSVKDHAYLSIACGVGGPALVYKFHDTAQYGAYAAGALCAGYCAKLAQHWYQLNEIEKRHSLSKYPVNFDEFRFGTWQQDNWPTAYSINNDKDGIKAALSSRSDIPVENSKLGNMAVLNKATQKEEAVLKADLEYIGNFTNIPSLLLQKIGEEPTFSSRDVQRALTVYKEFDGRDGIALNKVKDELLVKCKPHLGASALFMPSWNPRRWVVGPCYNKATKLFWELYKSYLRLQAIKPIIEELAPSTTTYQS